MWRRAIAILLVLLAAGITSCSNNRNIPVVLIEKPAAPPPVVSPTGALTEVSPPETIQQLKPFLAVYEPQVHIAQPQAASVLDETSVEVVLQVKNLPLYKDADLALGPHLHMFLDDRPYQPVYDVTTPITLTDLAPGTHTLRVLAVRPWNESFKNAGAYDQVTFSVFTPSPQNTPDPSQLLLTYGEPQGRYGTEPILLDFYLTNAPLHLIAEKDETIADWRLRCTINGESFVFDRWQPIYLQGFHPGINWIKLEAIDEDGTPLDNVFNTAVRTIDYTPGGEDSLSQLIRGEIALAQARAILGPNDTPATPKTDLEPAIETDLEPAVEVEDAGAEAVIEDEAAASGADSVADTESETERTGPVSETEVESVDDVGANGIDTEAEGSALEDQPEAEGTVTDDSSVDSTPESITGTAEPTDQISDEVEAAEPFDISVDADTDVPLETANILETPLPTPAGEEPPEDPSLVESPALQNTPASE